MLVVTALTAGCAKRWWSPVEKPLGDPELVEEEHAVRYQANTSLKDSPHGDVQIEVLVDRSFEELWSQDYRVFKEGRARPKDANAAGIGWTIAGLLAGAVAGGTIGALGANGTLADSQGAPPAPWIAPVVGASVFVPFLSAGIGNFLMQAPVRREVQREARPTARWTDWTRCSACAIELIDPSGRVQAKGTLDPRGAAELSVPAARRVPDELRLRVDGNPVEAGVDLRTTQAWQLEQTDRIRAQIAAGEFEDARSAIVELPPGDHRWRLEPEYCAATIVPLMDMGRGLDHAGAGRVLDGLELGFARCRDAWIAYRSAALQALGSKAEQGDVAAVDALVAALPTMVRGPADGLLACAKALETRDPRVALQALGEVARVEDDVVQACAERVGSAKQQTLSALIVEEERARLAEVTRLETCAQVGQERSRSAGEMQTRAYTLALRRAIERQGEMLRQESGATLARGGATDSELARIECIIVARNAGERVLIDLENAQGAGETLDAFSEGMLDAMDAALARDTPCARAIEPVMKIPAGAMRAHLTAAKKWLDSECER